MASIKNKSKLAATQSKQAKNNASPKATLQLFMQENIDRMHRLGKVRTGETYTCTLNSFMRFRQGKDVLWKDFDADLTASYEAYLKSTGVSMNTISFYNRILRAVYNRAVEKGFTKQVFPFKNVYTGVEKTIRRGLPINHSQHPKPGLVTLPLIGLCTRHVFIQLLHPRHVICGYGLPEKK